MLAEFGKRGVQPKKIMSLGSDGASVMKRVCFQVFLLYWYLDPSFFCDAKIGDNSVVRGFLFKMKT